MNLQGSIIDNLTPLDICKIYQNTQLALPYCKKNLIVSIPMTSLVTVCAVGVILRSFMIKERIFFVTTLSLLSVGIVTIPLLIWLQYRMFDLVASYEGCIKLARDRKLVGDELSKMAYGLACLLTIGQFTIDLAHWVFAIKFWDLSLKLRASVQNKELKAQKLSPCIFYSFIFVLLVLSAVYLTLFILVIQMKDEIWKDWLWNFFHAWAVIYSILPCFTSLSFLADGYRQFSKIPKGTLLISNRKMALHLICYGMILAAGVMLAWLYTDGLLNDLIYGGGQSKLNQELAIIIMLTIPNLTLIFILYTIILESQKQISYSTHSDTYQRSSQSTGSLLSLNNQPETSVASSTNDEIDFVSETLKARSAAPRQKSEKIQVIVEDLTIVDDLLIRHIGAD